jgi:O-acetyl-ADP-ribose deacetylase (regulator of RNase III)
VGLPDRQLRLVHGGRSCKPDRASASSPSALVPIPPRGSWPVGVQCEGMSVRLQIGEVTVSITEGDITEQDVDAIVNAANNHLWMGGGVAGAIKRKGGSQIEQEAVGRGPIAVGQAVATTAGALRARCVIHGAVMGQDLRTDYGKIRRTTLSSLEVAKKLGLRSVALPALGTGVGGFPMAEAADAMVAAVEEFSVDCGTVTDVRFVLFGQEAYEAFKESAAHRQQ